MVDYFGNRYWAQKYWATRYFQGGVLPEGSIEATLSSSGSLSANLTSTGRPAQQNQDQQNGGAWRRTKWRPRLPLKEALPNIPVFASARVTGSSLVTATAVPVAVASAKITGSSNVTGTGTFTDNYALEAEFWLMAA